MRGVSAMFFSKKPSMLDMFTQLYGVGMAKMISDRDRGKIEADIRKAEERARDFLRKRSKDKEKPCFVND